MTCVFIVEPMGGDDRRQLADLIHRPRVECRIAVVIAAVQELELLGSGALYSALRQPGLVAL